MPCERVLQLKSSGSGLSCASEKEGREKGEAKSVLYLSLCKSYCPKIFQGEYISYFYNPIYQTATIHKVENMEI